MNEDMHYMNEAIELAKDAASEGEVPVGAVVVKQGRIVGRGRNRRECEKNALAHAELEAIDEACRTLGGWRLADCTLYVTLEPCPMCAGAIVNSRIKRVVYGARDNKAGALGSVLNMNSYPLNHKCELCVGVCKDDCGELLTSFFKRLRK